MHDRRLRWMSAALLAALGTLASGPLLGAADRLPVAEAITGVRVVTAPGQVLESATVVIRDGVIEAVGADVTPPPEARVRDGEGLTLYPGLIEAFHSRPWPQPEGDGADGDAVETGHANALVNPERDALELAGDVGAAETLRGAGFTTALVVPGDGLWRGRGVLVNLGGEDLRQNVLRRDVVQAARFSTHGSYPNSLMGAVALFRQTLLDARWYQQAHEAWDRNPLQRRPPVDLSLEALGPVVRGEQTVLFEARDVIDLLRFASFVDELDLGAWVVGNGDEYRYLEQVAATGLPLIVPVDFPKAPELKDDELDNLDVELGDLVHWDLAPTNPARLAEAGVRFAFTSAGLAKPNELFGKVAQAIERGLSEEDALAALTTTPAAMLGVDGLLGTIEVGKTANLILIDGDLFVEQPKLRGVWVDGRHFELEEVKPPEVDPRGSWKLTLETGGPQIEVDLELGGELESLSGSMGAMGNSLPVQSAYVSGKTLTVSIDSSSMGAPGEIVMRLEISGDSASGSGESPMGSFSISGRRTAGPPEVQR